MWHLVKSYIQFFIKSTNAHGVHSPFVYNLITKCFYDKTRFKAYQTIKDYRQQLYQNNTTISVTDFGAGSRVFKSNQRAISKIAKNAGISNKRAKLLYRIMTYFKSENALELGTSVGIATTALSLGNPKGSVTTVEGCPETAKIANQQFEKFELNNIALKVSNFETELETLKHHHFDLIYIDGNHQKEATLNYFETLLNAVHNNSVIIFDDIHWSQPMTEAWEQIKQHPKVTVTIDTFFWGFVFFRKEQEKEHFIIRV